MEKERAMRRRFKQSTTLSERLDEFARAASLKATELSPGKERTDYLRKAWMARSVSELDDLLALPPTVRRAVNRP
jgi:hypothetical protein